MPIYEYECSTCGSHFERVERFGAHAAAACPNGHPNTRRVFSPPAIIFNGPGFYVTDSRSTGRSRSGKQSGSSEP